MIARLPIDNFYYLATPYTKYPGGIEIAFQHACHVAAGLLKDGYKAYSPIAHTHPIAIYGGMDPLDHKIWLPFDEAMMRSCNAIIVAKMSGWADSYGVKHEIETFTKAGKPLFYLEINGLPVARAA